MSDLPPPPPPPPVPACPPPPAPGLKVGNSSQGSLGPRPQTPMKRLQWVKIPEVKVKNSVNLWTNAMKMFPRLEVNFDRVEELFSCRTQNHLLNHSNHHNGYNGFSSSDPSHQSAFNCQRSEGLLGFPRDNSRDSVDGSSNHLEKRRKYEEVNLLDPKRSMNVNIFIRQLRLSNLELVEKLRQCNSESFDIETLKTLARLAPDEADKSILSGYKGDPDRLGTAEKFYLSLMSLPNFDLIIQTLLLKEEFYQSLDLLKPAIDSVIVCSKVVKESKAFHEVMYLVLLVGNFLNAGAYSGDAAAFKLCSLLQLIEIKANDNKLHLMHYVAQEIESKDPTLIEQLEELKYLSNASIHNISSLFSDMKSLKDDFTNNNRKLLSSSQTDDETKRRLQSMETAINAEMAMLETEAKDVESLRIDLSKYFCEDENTFKLDECMSIVNSFCKHFLHAHEENKERKLQNEKAEMKRLERQKLQRRLSSASGPSPIFFNTGDPKTTSPDNHGTHNRLTPTHSRSRSASCTRGSVSEGCNSLTEIADSTNDSHLLDVLLRPSPNGDRGLEARKFNSLRMNKRRPKNVAELWDRERFSLPLGSESQKSESQSVSPNNLAVQSTYNGTADRAEQTDSNLSTTTATTSQGLIRNGFARSSCPSRVQNSDKFHHNSTSRNVALPTEGNKNSENDRVEVRQTSSKKADLDRRLSREVAIGAASFEQQIRELESSLDYFDKDFDLNKTIDNYKCLNASSNESHQIPRIRLSSPEKLGVKQNSYLVAETNKSTASNDCKHSKGMRERFMKLTQLYSGKEPLEVQLHKPSTFGREVKASEVEGHNLRGILRDPRHAHTNLNYDKHLSEASECSTNFKDEGFDSEGFSNTSASQKSSRSSSRERDSGQTDWNVRINGEDKTHSHQVLGSPKKDPNKPEDNMSTTSSSHHFDRSIESLVSKELTVVDCSDVNKTLKKEAQEADRTPAKNKNSIQKQMNLNSNQSSSKITGSMLPSRNASKLDNDSVKVPNAFSVANKLSAMLSRTASKPASRVTAFADTKKPIVKTENKRTIESSSTSRLMTPINKARSLSRQTQGSPKLSRDSSTKSGQSTIKGCSKTSPRSSSMTGTRTPRSVPTVKAGPSISSQKRPSVGSTTSTISSDTSTKITHISRDTKPKIIKPSQATQLSKLSSRNSPLSTPQSSSSSTSTSVTDRRRTPSTRSTTPKALPMNSIFNRQSVTRSTLPAKLLSSSTKASSRESKISDGSTASKLVRPIKPNMNTTNSLATSRCTPRKPEIKSLKF